MRVTILGSGTLVPDDRRRSPGHLVDAGEDVVLLDCGSGTVHRMAGFGKPWRRISHLVLTHFHTDHVGDVAALFFALRHAPGPSREAPLRVLGPIGLASFLGGLAEAHGDHVLDPGYPLEVVEISAGNPDVSAGSFRLRAHPTPHTERSLAYRIETAEGAVGYTGDTGPSPSLGTFMEGVDLLVSECSHPDPPPMETHLTPRGVAELAARARPAMVVTVHHYPALDPARVPELVAAAGYPGVVLAGRDGLELEIEGHAVRELSRGETFPGGG